MRLALLFCGQGTQHATMLPWIDHDPAAAEALALMADCLGVDWRARLADRDWAASNAVAQCLITGTGLAAWHALRARLPPAAKVIAMAGYSVGELAAFAAAGVFDTATALAIAATRAEAMDRAAARAAGGLLSVIGPLHAVIEAVCSDCGTAVAIRIAPDRVVLGGSIDALDAAGSALAKHQADIVRLPVRVASHTGAMREAATALAQRFATMPWQAPASPLIVGRSGSAVRQVDGLKQALAEQTAHTIEWQAAMQSVAERRPDRVLEVGPGSSLSRIWRAAHPDIPVRSTDEFASVDGLVNWLISAGGGA